MRQTLIEGGRVVGYFYGCSRGRTATLCFECKRFEGKSRCARVGARAGKCGRYLCDRDDCSAADAEGNRYCNQHREEQGLEPSPGVKARRERQAAKEKRLKEPPRWIPGGGYRYRDLYCNRSAQDLGVEQGCGRRIPPSERFLRFPDYSYLCEGCGTTYQEAGGAVSPV